MEVKEQRDKPESPIVKVQAFSRPNVKPLGKI